MRREELSRVWEYLVHSLRSRIEISYTVYIDHTPYIYDDEIECRGDRKLEWLNLTE